MERLDTTRTITLSKTIGENMNLKLNSFGHHLIVGLESNNSAYVYRYNGYYWFQLEIQL